MINNNLPLVESVRWKDGYFSEIHCYTPFSLDELLRHTHNYLRGIYWEQFFSATVPWPDVQFPKAYMFDNGKTSVVPFVGYRGGAGFSLMTNAENTALRFSLYYIHADKILSLQKWVLEHPWKERLEHLGSPPKLTDIPKVTFDLYAATFPGGLFALKRYYAQKDLLAG